MFGIFFYLFHHFGISIFQDIQIIFLNCPKLLFREIRKQFRLNVIKSAISGANSCRNSQAYHLLLVMEFFLQQSIVFIFKLFIIVGKKKNVFISSIVKYLILNQLKN